MDNLARKKISMDEYFHIEETSEIKHEYYRGDIYAMAGASSNHNLIVSNLIRSLGNQFRNRPCLVYPSDMRVQVDENNHYTYPDVIIVCDKPTFLDDKKNTLINPTVIIEVLSESTELYDRGKKFQAYRLIPSLQNYILVASESKLIEVFTRNTNGQWVIFDLDSEGKIKISYLDCELSLDEVYEKVELDII
jgi:Uma2 family endonuclease